MGLAFTYYNDMPLCSLYTCIAFKPLCQNSDAWTKSFRTFAKTLAPNLRSF